jgi:hypothetical protein
LITSMEVISTQPDIPELPLSGFMPNHDPVQIRNIEGLGPVKSGIASTPFATGRGDLFQGASIEKRNIVITFGLNPNWADQSMTSLRQLLYRYFMTGFWTELRFFSDGLPTVYIRGVVESCEPNIFSQDPEMQVSVICPKPDLIDLETSVLTGSTKVISEGWDDVIWTNLSYASLVYPETENLDYIGTAPSGFLLRVEDAYTGPLMIFNATPDGYQFLSLTGVLVNSTQRLDVNTVRSVRYVHNVDTASEAAVNILAKMDKISDWPEFHPGANRFVVFATASIEWQIGFFNRFGGL